ncbi:DUF1330 domain-containing protein [Microbacterium sp. RD1]|uniref:DUF1330 domain-containing protein n=1 Tax=Microbacterium sp. RD1 TaxID=3457313 RepID=UPI003FA57C5C
MSAYVVFAVTEVKDFEQLLAYRNEAVSHLEAVEGLRFFAGPDTVTLEGPPIQLTVVVELEDLDAAKAWYYSDEYQKLASLRQGATEGFGFIVESWSDFGPAR